MSEIEESPPYSPKLTVTVGNWKVEGGGMTWGSAAVLVDAVEFRREAIQEGNRQSAYSLIEGQRG